MQGAVKDHAPTGGKRAGKQVGEWVPLAEAATRLGVSIDTMRRRVKRREVEAQQVASAKGPAWRVRMDTLVPARDATGPSAPPDRSPADSGAASAQVPQLTAAPETAAPAPPTPAEPLPDSAPVAATPSVPAPSVEAPRLDLPSVLTPPRHEALTAPSDAAIELVRLVGRLQEENRFLAGQVGFLQAQVDQAREAPGLLPATTGGHATQASPQDETRASRANGAAPAVSPPTGAPGQVLVDATELEELRRIREEYETETERLDQELARVQALMEELEEEDVAASHTEPPAESANSAPPPAPSLPHEPPKPTRPWWRAW